MEIRQIKATLDGAPADLQVSNLGSGLHVVLGPNGSGKTTLLRLARSLFENTINRSRTSRFTPAVSGGIELQNKHSSVRLVRIPRPGHPDTVAVIGQNAADIEGFRRSQAGVASRDAHLVRFVETSSVHQTSALARIARNLTERHCARELGNNWQLVRSLPAWQRETQRPETALIDVLRRLGDLSAERESHDGPPICDLTTIDNNWKTVIDALTGQREHLRLEWEARVSLETRQQEEWAAQLHWLAERADRQLARIAKLDGDWQAAASDLAARDDRRPQVVPPTRNGRTFSAAMPQFDVDRRLLLLTQVLEDLSRDRLQLMLQIAQTRHGAETPLVAELQRVDGCEREVVSRMQSLRQRRQQQSIAAADCVCPTCGASQSGESPRPASAPVDPGLTQRVRELQDELFAARADHAATCRSIARVDSLRRRFSPDTGSDQLLYAISMLDAQLDELQRRRRAELDAWAVMIQGYAGRRHDVLRKAGRNLSRLTSGRYESLRWSDDLEELLAAGPEETWTPVSSLSRGTSEQVAMSLRLAILRALSELGENGPILWDEPLADSDEHRLKAAAELLAEFGRTGMQPLVFTCREHVAQAMQAAGATIHRIGASYDAVPVTVASVSETPVEETARDDESVAIEEPAAVSMQVLPGSKYWLSLDAAVDQVPSISQQLARRLRALGVADLTDLLEFQPAANAVDLTDVQINAAQVSIWQAEARLLTEVPHLTGRDAQLLVSCGVLTRGQLATANIDELTQRVDRLRGGESLRWRAGPSTAPRRETIARWIAAAGGSSPADPSPRAKSSRDDETQSNRRRNRCLLRRTRPVITPASSAPRALAARFRLQPDSPIVDAPSIGHKTAAKLQRVGIGTVRDLLVCDPEKTAARIRRRRITAETIVTWQQQAGLMCSVPDLRCGDAIVLVACGINGPLDLRRISASALHATLEPFIASASGQRLLRGATPPSFEDMSRWIETVEESRVRRAA